MSGWKNSFAVNERFRIKDIIFEISHIGKRSLILKKISTPSEVETNKPNQPDPETKAELGILKA